jgi:hypothetical protein
MVICYNVIPAPRVQNRFQCLFPSYRFAIIRTYILENLYIPYVIVFHT